MKKKLNIILNIAIILTIANITYSLYLSKTAYKQIDITASTKIISSQNINYIKYYKDYYQNEDIIGILELTNSELVTLVPQTKDNTYYLNHLVNHEKSKLGSTFLDYRINLNNYQKLIIYGHNSYDNKTPFNKLANFLDYNYYLLHPTIKFTTEFFSDVYQIFSVYSTKTDYFHTNIYFNDDNSYLDHLKKLKERSIYNIDIDLTNSKTLILQTCLNNKTILIISAIKIGEANEKDNFIF